MQLLLTAARGLPLLANAARPARALRSATAGRC
jgi:hypothetical protein